MLSRVRALIVCTMLFAGCASVDMRPPTASLNPPSNTLGPVKATAWLKRVEITDGEMRYQELKEQLENTLTNNILRFLREGQYFRRVELLPGNPQPEDRVLQFRFDRYRAERNPDFFVPRRRTLRKDFTSDLSAVLTVTHPNGQVVREVIASSIEDSWTRGWPNLRLRARTLFIEDLLEKALFAPHPGP